ncbi:MAG: aminopeptidase family protein [Nocardioides sp.]|nr:aminopeptidase family protein [Nocardioides sp.]
MSIEQAEFDARIERTRTRMRAVALDALFIFSDEYRPGHSMYYTGFRTVNMIEESSEAVYLPLAGEPVVFTGSLNTFAASRDSRIPDVRAIPNLTQEIGGIVAEHPVRRVGIVGEDLMPVATYRMLVAGLGDDVEIVNAAELVVAERQIKTKAEIEALRRAGEIGDISLRATIRHASPGKTEAELVAIGEHVTRIVGGEFFGAYIAVSGPNTDLPTWRSSDRPVQSGELVMLDYAPVYDGYCGDVAATIAMDGVSTEQQDVLDFAWRAGSKMMEFMQPGRPANEVFYKTLELVREAGYEQYFLPYTTGMRAVGHGVGLDVVEPPDVGPNSTYIMEPGMVLAAKFDLHGFEWGGLRVEHVVAIHEDGPESLNCPLSSKCPAASTCSFIKPVRDPDLPW